MSSELTIQTIKEEVSQLLGESVHPNDLTFRSGVILCACMVVGTDLDAISEFTGYSKARGIIQNCLERMRETGIITVDGKLDLRWDLADPGVQAVAIVLDIMTIAGQVTRTPDG